jgi:hypothetical protein
MLNLEGDFGAVAAHFESETRAFDLSHRTAPSSNAVVLHGKVCAQHPPFCLWSLIAGLSGPLLVSDR